MIKEQVWIADFGSQYTQLITRKSRELGYSSLIMTINQIEKKFKNREYPKALILSGGPQSLREDPQDYSFLFENKSIPLLGICYGLQIMAHYLGGKVDKGTVGEYGRMTIHKMTEELAFAPHKKTFQVWMSHFDTVTKIPDNFKLILESENKLVAGFKSLTLPYLAYQFHPEVSHTEFGDELLNYFFKDIAKLKPDWNQTQILNEATEVFKELDDRPILCAFSGGVDSLVAASIAEKVSPHHLYCFFVDHGLLRPQDLHHLNELKEKTELNIEIIDAKEFFLKRLEGKSDPEEKRKIIGQSFIEIFEEKVHEFEKNHQIHFEYLLQGTLYPDVIESISPHQKDGKSVTIKSHHNVGGLPDRMKLKLVEPLRYLFKDEVRALGLQLGLKEEWIHRHPFPGPGIAIRILGEVNEERIRKVQESDQILFEELKNNDCYRLTWQAFTVLIPLKTVGVKGDARAYEEIIALRMVGSSDGMTAHFSQMPYEFLEKVSARICNEVKGITRVVYDITSKPPGTIEWE